eukprot:CCRYP_011870-RC/>CCRYP_011870-RC protein AED:0.39 eAED:0.40 QI:0/0/0/1/0/0/2/0/261
MISQLKPEFHSPVQIRLYYADGTTFGTCTQSTLMPELVFDSISAHEEHKTRGKRKRMNKSARSREKRRLLELSRQANNGDGNSNNNASEDGGEPSSMGSEEKTAPAEKESGSFSLPPFDRVLVDAECSSDATIVIVITGDTWDDSNMDELVDLQKRLIDSGFRLLKNGGILVYSTCSLSTRQNEDVVDWLLKKYNNAFIIPVSFSRESEAMSSISELRFIQEGGISGTVRFKPHVDSSGGDSVMSGGGFFLAKIRKRHDGA